MLWPHIRALGLGPGMGSDHPARLSSTFTLGARPSTHPPYAPQASRRNPSLATTPFIAKDFSWQSDQWDASLTQVRWPHGLPEAPRTFTHLQVLGPPPSLSHGKTVNKRRVTAERWLSPDSKPPRMLELISTRTPVAGFLKAT